MRKVIQPAAMRTLVGLVLVACGGSDGGNAPSGVPTAVNKNAGDFQTAILSEVFTTPVGVKVVDGNGDGVAGITVTWAVQSGSVTLAAGTSITAASGVATMAVTGGTAAGTAVVRATTTQVAGNTDFTLSVSSADRHVELDNILFVSKANGSSNAAVDTITAGQSVLWTWRAGNHSVRGSPTFSSGAAQSTPASGAKPSFQFTFTTPGTYQYDCVVHTTSMTGRVVVQ